MEPKPLVNEKGEADRTEIMGAISTPFGMAGNAPRTPVVVVVRPRPAPAGLPISAEFEFYSAQQAIEALLNQRVTEVIRRTELGGIHPGPSAAIRELGYNPSDFMAIQYTVRTAEGGPTRMITVFEHTGTPCGPIVLGAHISSAD